MTNDCNSNNLAQMILIIKRVSFLTLDKMQTKLGYKIDSINYFDDIAKRFYSNLRQVSSSIYEKTKREFKARQKEVYPHLGTILEGSTLKLEVSQMRSIA